MLFNSLEYLIFFPIVVILYFTIVAKYRWILLLAASYYFYMSWKPVYLILILISTGIDYVAGIQIENSEGKGRKRWFLALSLVSNLGILFFFKYYNFFRDSIDILLGGPEGEAFLPMLDVILPVGISFYTFQTLSYTIEVFWGNKKPSVIWGDLRCMSLSSLNWWQVQLNAQPNCSPSFVKNLILTMTE